MWWFWERDHQNKICDQISGNHKPNWHTNLDEKVWNQNEWLKRNSEIEWLRCSSVKKIPEFSSSSFLS